MADAINIEALTKNYGKLYALKNISLNLTEGAIYGLLGPNGAGKTTFIKTLVGASKQSSGNVSVLGLDPQKEKWKLRKEIGYMPQTPALYDDLSAKANVMFFGRGQKVKDLEKKTDEILAFAELSDRANDLVRNFSGGMKKRVSLCCSLIHSPKTLFLDEPTAAIDPHLKLQSWALFRKLAKQGVTLFISTHLMDEALLCDKVIILRNGELLALDTPEKILEKGKTKIRIRTENELIETTINSTPQELANELKKFGLSADVDALNLHPDNIEEIILSIVRDKNIDDQ